MHSDDRVDTKRRALIIAAEQRELYFANRMESEIASKREREINQEQEERLARELERIKLDGLRDEKLRQYVRETSHELRDLESKLKAGYTQRELAVQMAEKNAMASTQRQQELLTARESETSRLRQVEQAEQRRREGILKSKQYQAQLEYQLEEKEIAKQRSYEEFIKEKMMIDEIVRKINQEDAQEQERIAMQKLQTKREIEEFKEKRAQWRQQEIEFMEKENQAILAFAMQQNEREQIRLQQKIEKQQQFGKAQDGLAQEMQQKICDREEMDRIRQELYEEELQEEYRILARAEIEKKLRQRLELQQAEREGLEDKRRARDQEKADEERFRQAMLDKFAHDDNIEQMSAQKRRMKQLDHKRAVEELIDERRRRHEFEKEQERKAYEDEKQIDHLRRQIIEEERHRLLKEHAGKLIGFLPKGVLRSEEDLELLPEDARAAYRRPVDDDEDYY